tara:strand:+ start:1292 stop:2032 length:741 start_codon:yes stop_codon:yes gene_type:complete
MIKSISPKTAIIIVVYNAYEYVKICFKSLLENIDRHHEIIIIDNNSDKITKDYLLSLEHHEQIKLIINDDNRLWCPACNQGFDLVSKDTEYVLLLNSDVRINERDWISKMQKPMLSNKEIGLSGVQYNFNPLGPTYGALDGCCLMIRKLTLDTVGHFDENYPWNGAPYKFTQEAWNKGFKYYHIKENSLITHFGKKSRHDNKVQLKNNYIDHKKIISEAGLIPSFDIFTWISNKMSIFNINKKIKV